MLQVSKTARHVENTTDGSWFSMKPTHNPAHDSARSKQVNVYLMLFYTLFLIFVFVPFCFAEMYSWKDDKGTLHYTSNIHSIPLQYRDKAKLVVESKEKKKPTEIKEPENTDQNQKISDFSNKKTVVKFRQSGSSLVVSVTLNDSKQALFIVDTGATITTISPKVAAELGIIISEETPGLSVNTANGIIEAPLIKIKSIKVNEAEQNDIMAIVHDAVPGYAGLLGLTFLNEYNYSINPIEQELVLKPLDNPSKEKLFGGHSLKWWQRKFRILRGFIQKEKSELEKLIAQMDHFENEDSLLLIEERIQKKQINLDFFEEEFNKIENEASLAMVPIQWQE